MKNSMIITLALTSAMHGVALASGTPSAATGEAKPSVSALTDPALVAAGSADMADTAGAGAVSDISIDPRVYIVSILSLIRSNPSFYLDNFTAKVLQDYRAVNAYQSSQKAGTPFYETLDDTLTKLMMLHGLLTMHGQDILDGKREIMRKLEEMQQEFEQAMRVHKWSTVRSSADSNPSVSEPEREIR